MASIGVATEARIAFDNFRDRITSVGLPTLRIGVSGLSRAGKTVFITALVNALVGGGRLPLFRAQANGRISRATIVAQPDDDVPRFQVEDHTRTLLRDRAWPDSTRAIAQTRVLIEYESESAWISPKRKLALDIVDYPGEWLLDLPLLEKDFATFSREAAELAKLPGREELAREWQEAAAALDPDGEPDEAAVTRLHEAFRDYLRACREDRRALSTLPPGRFLMPGDLEGSPALTFAPLPGVSDAPKRGSLGYMLRHRYEAYKDVVVRPFFRDHFARLDRQVVLIDVLQAMNAGAEAVTDLSRALTEVMRSFRPGTNNPISRLFSRRIDRMLLAATKADHLHHQDHDRLEAIVSQLVVEAARRAGAAGAMVDTAAIAAVRATREARQGEGSDALPLIVGTPIAGERIDGRTFDGQTEIAIFPGDLPRDPHDAITEDHTDAIQFVRFRPPELERDARGAIDIPHIRLDRALEHLLGDRLR